MVLGHVPGNLAKASPFIDVQTSTYFFIRIPVVSHDAEFLLQSWLRAESWR